MDGQDQAGTREAGPYDGWSPAHDLHTDIPHPARMYDYYLGGKDNFPADRAAAEKAVELFPTLGGNARANRRFLARAVRLAAASGIGQFLDIGTGIPSANNTHEVAQSVNSEARVVYTDNDPIVLAHARALLRGTPQGRTAYLDADVRDPDAILASPGLASTLDLTQPVALMLVAVLHFLPDSDNPQGIVEQLKAALPSGSMLICSHGTLDFASDQERAQHEEFRRIYSATDTRFTALGHGEVLRFFDGWNLVEPGLVPLHEWHTDDPDDLALTRETNGFYGGVAVKP